MTNCTNSKESNQTKRRPFRALAVGKLLLILLLLFCTALILIGVLLGHVAVMIAFYRLFLSLPPFVIFASLPHVPECTDDNPFLKGYFCPSPYESPGPVSDSELLLDLVIIGCVLYVIIYILTGFFGRFIRRYPAVKRFDAFWAPIDDAELLSKREHREKPADEKPAKEPVFHMPPLATRTALVPYVPVPCNLVPLKKGKVRRNS